jgi:hypothetical protein
LGASEKVATPLPVPLLPDVIVIQDALDTAVQPHVLAEAVTAMVPLVDDCCDGATVKVQLGFLIVTRSQASVSRCAAIE